ncbi:serine/threonine-protein kinase [Mycolicibacterium sp. BiH015]|uniref:serine/threonine-protein kinase n=1 Tax=Mycolicibacterium sp. BiH015 TaxID=3018808 RepID=UPI0022E1D211|nr:serine/threonine-protein kinase [Mycolicibacterium sp. BiH015]MDA2889772.1 serine/threonine-protein kinase [Mycolicibacterium sp. BiH015]
MTGPETLVGRYEVRGPLGIGGMAEVRDGWDTRLDRPVAVKLLHPSFQADPDARRRFEVEARSAAPLSHPNIVAIHDFGDHDGTPFIVMERLPGRTLADVIALGPMPPAQVRSMLDDVLAALTVAHAAGVLHRDIKPGNVLLSADGRSVKVADFGIAKSAGAALTATGQVIGTMCYMSPERVTGAPASVSDDLYAVGLMGYEALLGHRAFPQDNPVALARAIVDSPPPPLSSRTGVDPVLAAVIDRAMNRDPRARFGSAAQMRAALAGDVTALTAGAQPPRPATRVLAQPLPDPTTHFVAPPDRPKSRRRAFLLAAAVLASFALAALALALDPFTSTAPQETVSTSTSVPPPRPTSTPPPALPMVPVTQPAPQPVVEEPVKPDRPGNGNGHGNGNGKKPKP